MKLAIVTQIRNESKRLEEWIKFHYYYYNIDLFFFYLDNSEDNSQELLENLKSKYNIEYENTEPFGEYNGNNCMVSGAIDRQRISFTKGYNYLKYDYDWIGVFDVDEWIVPLNINSFNFKNYLLNLNDNMLYIPMYNFKPTFNYDKSITEQNLYRWSTEERFNNGHGTCGKSIIRGKVFLDEKININVHTGPENNLDFYHKNIDLTSKNHQYRLYQWQNHNNHINRNYDIYDDKIKIMFNNIK